MVELVVFAAGMLAEPQLSEWQAWLRHHGIDPNDVLVTAGAEAGFIARDVERRRISYRTLNTTRARTGPLTEMRTVQLEAEPSPFPTSGYSAGLRWR